MPWSLLVKDIFSPVSDNIQLTKIEINILDNYKVIIHMILLVAFTQYDCVSGDLI